MNTWKAFSLRNIVYRLVHSGRSKSNIIPRIVRLSRVDLATIGNENENKKGKAGNGR